VLNLSVIVVNYNSGEIIKDCLASVFDKITGIDFEVIVSDNGSTDGSVEMIKMNFRQCGSSKTVLTSGLPPRITGRQKLPKVNIFFA